MTKRDQVVARARGCIGARFRPQGRKPDLGLDCVGVAAIAFARDVPGDYPVRGGKPEDVAAMIAAAGLRPIPQDKARAGDLLLIGPSALQLHLAVLTGEGFVHADAGLRRVVETPGRPRDAILGAWAEQG